MRPSRIIQNGVVEYVCSLIFPQRSVQWRRRFGTTRDLHHSQAFTKSTFLRGEVAGMIVLRSGEKFFLRT